MEVEEKVVREELNMGDREVVKVSEEVKKKVYVVPTKQVKTVADIALWEASQAYQEYLGFIIAIGEAIKGKKLTDEVGMSPCCERLVALLAQLRGNIQTCPPTQIDARYGNPAYRDWWGLLEGQAAALLEQVVGQGEARAAVPELVPYLLDSFGNPTRIDYGTGHEMAFVMLLCCLFHLGALDEADLAAVGLRVFAEYMALAREVQQGYRMEPAGSMGVWNLDDFQFVSFIWGAAQLGAGARVKPKAIPDPDMADLLAGDYHLFACLQYIHKVKSGPFPEHSNQLWNISAVPAWPKVFTGLIKMYRAEVLSKFPVIQHSLFGSLLSLAPSTTTHPLLPPSEHPCRPPGPGVDSPRPPAHLPRPPGPPEGLARGPLGHLKL